MMCPPPGMRRGGARSARRRHLFRLAGFSQRERAARTAPLLDLAEPQWPDRPRYMVDPLCQATAGSATIRKFHLLSVGRCYRSGRPGSGSWRIVPSNIS